MIIDRIKNKMLMLFGIEKNCTTLSSAITEIENKIDKLESCIEEIKKHVENINDSTINANSILIYNLFADHYMQNVEGRFFELQILCDKYGSDKGSVSLTDDCHVYPWRAHTYAYVYEMLFRRKKNNVRYVFECGIGTNNETLISSMGKTANPGASLRVWRDYFTSIQFVYGADIDRDILFEEEKIKTGYMDQTSKASIDEYFSSIEDTKFDIMIDDGLHTYDGAITLFECSIKYLSKDGIYIIEDVYTSYIHMLYDYFKDKHEFMINYIPVCSSSCPANTLITIQYR